LTGKREYMKQESPWAEQEAELDQAPKSSLSSQAPQKGDISSLLEHKPTLLRSSAAFLFNDSVLKYPLHTLDDRVVVGTSCLGYSEKTYLVVPAIQVGCPVQCNFCQVGDQGYERSLTAKEIVDEIALIVQKSHQYGYPLAQTRVKISFVADGDPLTNPNFGQALEQIAERAVVPMKVSTAYPDTPLAERLFDEICSFSATYGDTVQFQISLNSTDAEYRARIAKIPLADYRKIREAGEKWQSDVPHARKVNLTFTLTQETPCTPEDIKDILTPDLFAIRLRDWAPTERGLRYGLHRIGPEKLKELADRFVSEGYNVIPGRTGNTERMFILSAGQLTGMYQSLLR